MDDSLSPDPAAQPSPARATAFDRLSRQLARLLDADLILPQEGVSLLETIDRARRCDHAGDRQAARRHLTCLQRAIEALVHSGRLEEPLGRPALQSVRHMLGE
jgi:hypothetical protein